jgi:hypothetical protein
VLSSLNRVEKVVHIDLEPLIIVVEGGELRAGLVQLGIGVIRGGRLADAPEGEAW